MLTRDLAGAVLRVAFHDAGTYNATAKTGGADGSIQFELAQAANAGVNVGFALVQQIQALVNPLLTGVSANPVTLADLIQLAGVEAIGATGGPCFTVPLGRKDAAVADPAGMLPSPNNTATQLVATFTQNGLNTKWMVALSGAHTIGRARTLGNFVLDPVTPVTFDNAYYISLVNSDSGPFLSDRSLATTPATAQLVQLYAQNNGAWIKDFVDGYIAMSLLGTS